MKRNKRNNHVMIFNLDFIKMNVSMFCANGFDALTAQCTPELSLFSQEKFGFAFECAQVPFLWN